MQQRVMDFFDYLWVRNKGTDRQTLLADMPYCMQAEVSMATTEPLMRNVKFTTMSCMLLYYDCTNIMYQFTTKSSC